MNEMNTDRALNWDDEFTNEQQEFVLLPEGDYAFEVTGMERARFEGSAKLPPCSMAKLTLKIFGGAKGDTTVTDRLYLHTKTQGLLGAFQVVGGGGNHIRLNVAALRHDLSAQLRGAEGGKNVLSGKSGPVQGVLHG